jgi:hypothetical protein
VSQLVSKDFGIALALRESPEGDEPVSPGRRTSGRRLVDRPEVQDQDGLVPPAVDIDARYPEATSDVARAVEHLDKDGVGAGVHGLEEAAERRVERSVVAVFGPHDVDDRLPFPELGG